MTCSSKALFQGLTSALAMVVLGCSLTEVLVAEEDSIRSSDASELFDRVKQLDDEIESIRTQEQSLHKDLLEKRRVATEGERKWQGFLGEIEQNRLQQKDLNQSLDKARKDRDQALVKQKELMAAVEVARKELASAQQRLKAAEENAGKATAQLKAAENPIAEWEKQLSGLADLVGPLEVKAAQAKEDALPAMDAVQRAEARAAELASQRKETARQIETLLKGARQWVSFSEQVAPIFQQNCVACHHSRNAQGQYNMLTFDALTASSESGQPIVPGHADQSLLVKLIEDGSMPSDAEALSNEQIATIRKWIDLGARLDMDADPNVRLVRLMPRVVQPKPPAHYSAAMPVTALAIAPDGQRLISAGYHELLVWSLPTPAIVLRITDVAERVYGLDFHRDGKRVAVASGTPGRLGEVKIFDVETGERLKDLLVSEDVVFDVAFSPDGNRLAACAADGSITIFSLGESAAAPMVIEDHSDWVNSIAWSADGKQLVSSSRDKTVKRFDAETGKLQITVTGHGQNVTSAIFSDDGNRLISGGDDRRVRVWKSAEATEVRAMAVGLSEINDLQLLAGDQLLVAGSEPYLRLYQIADGKELWKLKLPSAWVVSAVVAADGRMAFCGTQDGQILRIKLTDNPAVDLLWQARP